MLPDGSPRSPKGSQGFPRGSRGYAKFSILKISKIGASQFTCYQKGGGEVEGSEVVEVERTTSYLAIQYEGTLLSCVVLDVCSLSRPSPSRRQRRGVSSARLNGVFPFRFTFDA